AEVATLTDPNVAQTHAANTLLRHGEGKAVQWSAFNTDYTAALDTLRAGLASAPEGMSTTLQSRGTLILGAGGVARSIAHALHREGSLVTISSRTAERARKLAEEIDSRWVDWVARHSVNADIVINCTPVGMHPNIDESPLP